MPKEECVQGGSSQPVCTQTPVTRFVYKKPNHNNQINWDIEKLILNARSPLIRCEEPNQACQQVADQPLQSLKHFSQFSNNLFPINSNLQVPEVKCTKVPITTREEVCNWTESYPLDCVEISEPSCPKNLRTIGLKPHKIVALQPWEDGIKNFMTETHQGWQVLKLINGELSHFL